MIVSDKDMTARIGRPTKGLQFILLGETLFHPVTEGWEPYPDEEVAITATEVPDGAKAAWLLPDAATSASD